MDSRRFRFRPAHMVRGGLMAGLMLFGLVEGVSAQTVSSYQPVISSGNYITSSSPLPNGGRVQAVYYATGERNVSVTSNPNRTVPAAFNPQTEVRRIPTAQTQFAPVNSGFQSVYSNGSNIQVVTATTAQSQTAQPGTTLNRVPTLPQTGNVPAASTQPTLPYNAVPQTALPQTTLPQTTLPQTTLPQTTLPQTTLPQNVVPQGNVAVQNPGQLNWQPVSGQPGAPVYAYPTNGVTAYNPCNPQPTVAYQPAAKPVKNYKPLIPLRKHVPRETYVAQGMFGQPKAYVAGQGVRNFFRYILP